jgi:hypothetical protein
LDENPDDKRTLVEKLLLPNKELNDRKRADAEAKKQREQAARDAEATSGSAESTVIDSAPSQQRSEKYGLDQEPIRWNRPVPNEVGEPQTVVPVEPEPAGNDE